MLTRLSLHRAALTLLVLAGLPARAELVDRVAAVVNNDIIALSEVEARAAPELQKAAAEKSPEARVKLRDTALKAALDQLIAEKLLEAELKDLNIEMTEQ